MGIRINIHYSYKTSLKYSNIYAKISVCNENKNIKKFIELIPLSYCKRKLDIFKKVYSYILYKEKKEKEAHLIYSKIMKDSKTLKICQIAEKYKIPWSTVNNYIKGTRTHPTSIKFLSFNEYSSTENLLNGETLIN